MGRGPGTGQSPCRGMDRGVVLCREDLQERGCHRPSQVAQAGTRRHQQGIGHSSASFPLAAVDHSARALMPWRGPMAYRLASEAPLSLVPDHIGGAVEPHRSVPSAMLSIIKLGGVPCSRVRSRAPGPAPWWRTAPVLPFYGWFTEGFDTADLQEAQALIEELS